MSVMLVVAEDALITQRLNLGFWSLSPSISYGLVSHHTETEYRFLVAVTIDRLGLVSFLATGILIVEL